MFGKGKWTNKLKDLIYDSKILHYVWVGSKIPERVQSLINHNKKHTPDYIIKVWSEKNLPSLNSFAKNAYGKKNWAFVSDYVRFCGLKEIMVGFISIQIKCY